MKHIQAYKIFESQEPQHPGFPDTEEEIHKICKKYHIENYTINDDLSISVDGDVDLSEEYLGGYLPLSFNFVSGFFNCFDNQLMSLEGSPIKIGNGFSCDRNELKSLKYCPKIINGGFWCRENNLETLEGMPKKLDDNFDCSNNLLRTLKGVSENINGGFSCDYNDLISLENLPSGIDYSSHYTRFQGNPISSVVGTFIKNEQAEDLIREFNDYSIVRGDKVVLNRLKTFISDFDLEMPNLDEVKKHYKIV